MAVASGLGFKPVDYDAEAGKAPLVARKEGGRDDVVALARGGPREAPRGEGLKRFVPPPLTLSEVLTVRRYFKARYPGGTVRELEGAGASEEAFRGAAPRSRYIHLATHGFFAPPELRSALEEKEGAGGPGSQGGKVSGFHPGLLSGIVLAGANEGRRGEGDDGILTALELAPVDLGRTELMVFSACETGLGAVAGGEGILGLQRAASRAGAKTVVASLWSVDDLDTMALMVRFYENLWRKGQGKLAALCARRSWRCCGARSAEVRVR